MSYCCADIIHIMTDTNTSEIIKIICVLFKCHKRYQIRLFNNNGERILILPSLRGSNTVAEALEPVCDCSPPYFKTFIFILQLTITALVYLNDRD